MRKLLAAMLMVATMLGSVDAASAHHANPPDRDRHIIGMRYGDRLSFEHDGPLCWWYSVGPHGRPRAILVAGERSQRGAPCRGRRLALVRLPRSSHQGDIHVWQVGTRVLLWVPDWAPL